MKFVKKILFIVVIVAIVALSTGYSVYKQSEVAREELKERAEAEAQAEAEGIELPPEEDADVNSLLIHHLGDMPWYALQKTDSGWEIVKVEQHHGEEHVEEHGEEYSEEAELHNGQGTELSEGLEEDQHNEEEPFSIVIFSKHCLLMLIICAMMISIFIPLGRMYKKRPLNPTKFMNFFEAIIEFIREQVIRPNFHGDTDKWSPFFLTMFFFILFGNLLGMIPNAGSITGNLAVTMAMALITLFVIFGYGFKKKGIKYLKLWPDGVPLAIVPIMFPIELVSVFTRCFALMIRLFANMTGGHAVLTILLYLIILSGSLGFYIAPISIAASVAMSILEIFVAFLQAFIFTFLSALFISMAGQEH